MQDQGLRLVQPPERVVGDQPPPELLAASEAQASARFARWEQRAAATSALVRQIGQTTSLDDAATQLKTLRSLPNSTEPPSAPGHSDFGPQSAGPPYAFSWPWSSSHGGPGLAITNEPTSGNIGLKAYNNEHAWSGASAWLVEGHYFQPTSNFAKITVLPSLTYDWLTISILFGASHSDGAIGIFIGAYDDHWNWRGPLVDVPAGNLWSGGGNSGGDGSTSGYGMSLTLSNLVPTFHYAVGVKIGVNISAAGSSAWPVESDASARIAIRLPSLTWET